MESMFVLVDVGCIECGEPTDVVGAYTDESRARRALDAHVAIKGGREPEAHLTRAENSTLLASSNYFAGGQHCIELHNLLLTKVTKGV